MNTIAFDVDGTLIDNRGNLRPHVLRILLSFIEIGSSVVIWSGGGVGYAETWARRIGLTDKVRVIGKGTEIVDIAFDDEIVTLGKVNIKI